MNLLAPNQIRQFGVLPVSIEASFYGVSTSNWSMSNVRHNSYGGGHAVVPFAFLQSAAVA
jgi:hypothetical protein